jgi:hypothetical protein
VVDDGTDDTSSSSMVADDGGSCMTVQPRGRRAERGLAWSMQTLLAWFHFEPEDDHGNNRQERAEG